VAKKAHKKTRADGTVLIPAEVRALFGDPPILSTEDAKLYWSMLGQFAKCVEPQDIIEWLWVKDVVDLSWEISRLRRLKIDLIEIQREDENPEIERDREHSDEPYESWPDGKLVPRAPEDIEVRKNAPLRDTYRDSTKLLWQFVNQYEAIEPLLTSAEHRRDRILREIEVRREHVGRRLRAASDETLEMLHKAPRIAAE
jgi:hypothetical protein